MVMVGVSVVVASTVPVDRTGSLRDVVGKRVGWRVDLGVVVRGVAW